MIKKKIMEADKEATEYIKCKGCTVTENMFGEIEVMMCEPHTIFEGLEPEGDDDFAGED